MISVKIWREFMQKKEKNECEIYEGQIIEIGEHQIALVKNEKFMVIKKLVNITGKRWVNKEAIHDKLSATTEEETQISLNNSFSPMRIKNINNQNLLNQQTASKDKAVISQN